MAIMLIAPSELGLPMTLVTRARGIISRPESLTSTSTRSPSCASPRSPMGMRISFCLRSIGISRAPSSSRRTMPIWARRGLSRIFIGLAVYSGTGPSPPSMRARMRSPGAGTTRALRPPSTVTRGFSPSSSFHCAGKAWRLSASASAGISSTVTEGSAAVRRSALRVRVIRPSLSSSASIALNGRRMSPRMPKTLARSRLPLRSGSCASASSNCSRVGSASARGCSDRFGPEVFLFLVFVIFAIRPCL